MYGYLDPNRPHDMSPGIPGDLVDMPDGTWISPQDVGSVGSHDGPAPAGSEVAPVAPGVSAQVGYAGRGGASPFDELREARESLIAACVQVGDMLGRSVIPSFRPSPYDMFGAPGNSLADWRISVSASGGFVGGRPSGSYEELVSVWRSGYDVMLGWVEAMVLAASEMVGDGCGRDASCGCDGGCGGCGTGSLACGRDGLYRVQGMGERLSYRNRRRKGHEGRQGHGHDGRRPFVPASDETVSRATVGLLACGWSLVSPPDGFDMPKGLILTREPIDDMLSVVAVVEGNGLHPGPARRAAHEAARELARVRGLPDSRIRSRVVAVDGSAVALLDGRGHRPRVSDGGHGHPHPHRRDRIESEYGVSRRGYLGVDDPSDSIEEDPSRDLTEMERDTIRGRSVIMAKAALEASGWVISPAKPYDWMTSTDFVAWDGDTPVLVCVADVALMADGSGEDDLRMGIEGDVRRWVESDRRPSTTPKGQVVVVNGDGVRLVDRKGDSPVDGE